ncbi:MAG: hypothetical protein M2R45_03558 [Verrucomicrobia subdivision 3 bacterium]|nr:hypothetical protein [Limisphaerales bacterium]MCS1416465.1 hypothetical protein [Limisphaerales bacterium]
MSSLLEATCLHCLSAFSSFTTVQFWISGSLPERGIFIAFRHLVHSRRFGRHETYQILEAGVFIAFRHLVHSRPGGAPFFPGRNGR